jgi:hypothetical protein
MIADAQASVAPVALAQADANPHQALRGAISDVATPTARTGGVSTVLASAAFILAPVMVQMLSALDPTPSLAGEPADPSSDKLRRATFDW